MRRCSLPIRLLALIGAVATTGCASTLTAITNRPISSDHLDEFNRNGIRIDQNKLKTLSGDRRLLRVQFTDEQNSGRSLLSDGTYNTKWIICAETQADAIAARGGQSALTINAKGSGTDEYIESLTVTNVRSQISDVVRQLGWQVCNAFMNGALTKAEYKSHLEELRKGAFLALKVDTPTAQNNVTAGTTQRATPQPDPTKLPEAPAKPCKPKKDKPCPPAAGA